MKQFELNRNMHHNDSIVARAAVCSLNSFSQMPSIPTFEINKGWTYVSASCVEDDYEGF